MPPDDTGVQELRQLFEQGATPSMLIRHLIRRSPDGDVNAAVLRECMEAAFCLPMARYIRAGVDFFSDVDYCVAVNQRLLPEILQHQQDWNPTEQSAVEPGGKWYEGLTSTPPEIAREAADQAAHPRLSAQSWASLSAAEQDALRLEMASLQTMTERLHILAALVERLQQQVEELRSGIHTVDVRREGSVGRLR